jgi:hypothetical protein
MRAFTRRPIERELLGNDRSTAHRFAFSPPVLCVSSASGFLLASALSLHEPLRTPGAEDARCVEPTSATRTKTSTRPPYVLDSRERLSPLGMPRDSPWLSRCVIEATSIFTMLEALRPHFTAPSNAFPRAFFLTDSGHERGPIRPAALDGMRPLTPLSRTLLPLRAHVTFVRGLESTRVPLWFRTTWIGSEE